MDDNFIINGCRLFAIDYTERLNVFLSLLQE